MAWWKWLWARLNDASTLAWLLGLASASTVTSRMVSLMPGGWHPPQYWALAASWFFGTLFVVMGSLRVGVWIWKLANPVTLKLVAHGGSDVSITCCPSESGDFYGVGWLEGKEILRKKPFYLSWGAYSGQYKRIRGGDKTTLAIAEVDGHRSTYGADPHLHILEASQIGAAYAESWPLKDWIRGGAPKHDLPWIDLRIELRAKQLSNIWKFRYRFRLTKELEFEVEEL